LLYALALGSAGPGGSNPVEASRLLTELLAGPNDLTSEETALAQGFAREFDARVKLYADLARQREESDARAAALANSAEHRADVLAAENARLRRALSEAERKLRVVAEMERQLLEQSSESESTPPQP
jgi:F0F1-type ATP synthase epsilon subunit